jgi:nicotinamidase-related amidase
VGGGACLRSHSPDPRLDAELTAADLISAPTFLVIDKAHYSPFKEQAFLRFLGRLGADAMILSGGETDVCVLAAVTDAGYRVILAEDALCSASDESQTPSCGNSARASASRSRSRRSRRSSPASAQ